MAIRGALAACVLCAVAGSAAAEPQLAWRAPSACPDADDARARVERRLGEPMARFALGVDVAIDRAPVGYVAHVGDRTLTSETCDDLTEAVALVVARLATDAPRRDAPLGPAVWGLGVRGSWLSGIGGVPSVGMGGALAVYVRHDRLLVELGAADWMHSSRPASGVTDAVDIGLTTATVRVGYAPEPRAIRGWLGLDVGQMSGEPMATTASGTAPWVALGPGFAVEWPISPRWRVVGTLELMATLTRLRVVLQDGTEVYAPSPLSARITFGLEVGLR